jgi:hypothetical protein
MRRSHQYVIQSIPVYIQYAHCSTVILANLLPFQLTHDLYPMLIALTGRDVVIENVHL